MSAEEREREQTLRAKLTTLNSQIRRETASAEPNQTRVDMLGTQIQNARLDTTLTRHASTRRIRT